MRRSIPHAIVAFMAALLAACGDSGPTTTVTPGPVSVRGTWFLRDHLVGIGIFRPVDSCEGISSLNLNQTGTTLSGEVFRTDECVSVDGQAFTVDSRTSLETRDSELPGSRLEGMRVRLTGVGPFGFFILCTYTGDVAADESRMSGRASCISLADSLLGEAMRGTSEASKL